MKKLLVVFLLISGVLFASTITDEERNFWERVNPEQLKKWENTRSQMGNSVSEDQKSKQKEDMGWRVTMNSLSASNSKEWGKVVTMPDNCKNGLDNKLYDIMAISTNVLNQHPKDWLNGKYLEFVNSQCSLYNFINTTPKSLEKTVDSYFDEKENGNSIGLAEIGFIIAFIFIFWTMTKYRPMRFIY